MGLALGNMLTSPAQVQHLAASPHYPCLAPAWRGVFTNESRLSPTEPLIVIECVTFDGLVPTGWARARDGQRYGGRENRRPGKVNRLIN